MPKIDENLAQDKLSYAVLPFIELPDIWSSLSLKWAGGAGIELCMDWTARIEHKIVNKKLIYLYPSKKKWKEHA